jgi:FdhD protein
MKTKNDLKPLASLAGVAAIETTKVQGSERRDFVDTLSVEEPLEIRLTAYYNGVEITRPVAITMRTPGEDYELACGFLFTEGIIENIADIVPAIDITTIEVTVTEAKPRAKRAGHCNIVHITLKEGVVVPPGVFERHSFVASSCGVCGKKSIEAVKVRRNYELKQAHPQVRAQTLHKLPDSLRQAQSAFEYTGGIHASGLFDASGELIMLAEDVGRHNALDKVIGRCAIQGLLPLQNHILLVSGRASFELVQKAAHAGLAVMAAVGAPSSLAVQLAKESGMTLLGFVRDDRFNIYCGAERVQI